MDCRDESGNDRCVDVGPFLSIVIPAAGPRIRAKRCPRINSAGEPGSGSPRRRRGSPSPDRRAGHLEGREGITEAIATAQNASAGSAIMLSAPDWMRARWAAASGMIRSMK